MSNENVEIVLAAQGQDLIQWLREDAVWRPCAESLHADFDNVSVTRVETPITRGDADALRRAWLRWVAPWESYEQEVDEAIDCGDRVLLLVTNFPRAAGSDHDVQLKGASIWTVHESPIVRMEATRTAPKP